MTPHASVVFAAGSRTPAVRYPGAAHSLRAARLEEP